jgi:hypothetical protein
MRAAKRARRTRAQVANIEDALYRLLERDNPMTLRQLFYRAVSAGLVAKTENDYKNTVGRLLLKMRLAGRVPFRWVADNTRWMRKPTTWSSLEAYCNYASGTYRRALWDDQDAYVEVWTEKDALAGVLMEETRQWDVPLMVSRGFSSVTYLYEAAATIREAGKPAFLYYFGDHDPSGLRIDAAIERRLREFAPDADIRFERVAVTPQQIEDWHLPTRPTKTEGNTHAKGFAGGSVEVDAIEPARLRQLVRGSIERHIDADALGRTRRVEALERQSLRTFLPNRLAAPER